MKQITSSKLRGLVLALGVLALAGATALHALISCVYYNRY